jgi:nucleoside phosphorylase
VLRAFGFRRVGSGLYRARLKDRDVLLCLSGIGPKRAREAAVRLCQAGVKELVSAGFCGALSSDLRVGDLLTDRVVSSPVPVRTKEERRTLAQRANARAVDMETQAIVEAGTRLGVPIRVLRVVSDLYEDDLTALFGSDTRISPWRIALRLIRPRAWPLAWRLHRQSEAAKAALLSAFERFFSDHP